MTKEEREKAINKIMGYLATYLSVEQYAEAERIIKELRQDTVSRESYDHEYFLRKELDFKIAKLEKAIEELEQENCEDAVSRKAVLDLVNSDWKYEGLEVLDDCPLVEIVTCKDCKHRDPEDKFCDCGHAIKWSAPREDNFYCADAERKE